MFTPYPVLISQIGLGLTKHVGGAGPQVHERVLTSYPYKVFLEVI